jgi:alpha-L-fucosidase 2
MYFLRKLLIIIALFLSVIPVRAGNSPLVLKYDSPVNQEISTPQNAPDTKAGKNPVQWSVWGLPLGNGRLGAIFYGNPGHESLQFNEVSLWTGNDVLTPTAKLFPNYKGVTNSQKGIYGSYQPFGSVEIDLPHSSVTKYQRTLDLDRGMGTVTYDYNGTNYHREYFASYPDQVLVMRLTADHPGSYSGTIRLTDRHQANISMDHATVTARGTLKSGFSLRKDKAASHGPAALTEQNTTEEGMIYESQMRVIAQGGSVTAGANGEIHVENADGILILLAAGTDYLPDYAKKWKGDDPHPRVSQQLLAAAARSYDELLKRHLGDYQSLFERFKLDLGRSSDVKNAMSTPVRLDDYRKNPDDPELEALVAQYGRYLLISSSRSGSLPANLQGIWNPDNYSPPWASDYHLNINLQMNYWLSGPANLSECALPPGDWLLSLMPHGIQQTKELYGTRGWQLLREVNLFGGGGGRDALFNKVELAWMLQNIYEHYAFTGDVDWLRKVAYPMIEQAVLFFEDSLVEKNGTLLVPFTGSPEQGPLEDGVVYSQELVWELFTEYVELSKVLGINADHAAKVESMLKRLATPKIGSWGQLMEWQAEYPSMEKSGHRHVSHCVALFPGRQIAPTTTPELAKGAEVILLKRGDKATGWSKIFKAGCWARLGNGDHAHLLYQRLIQENLAPNLFDMISGFDKSGRGIFQIDANFGAPDIVCEMLLQSQTGEIVLLPALPGSWLTGSVRGICARGGFVLDVSWADGKLSDVVIHSKFDRECGLRYRNQSLVLPMKKGDTLRLNGKLQKETP